MTPPTDGMPDNHCYPMWYNSHGIDIQPSAPRANGCLSSPAGTMAAVNTAQRGLDSAEVMESATRVNGCVSRLTPAALIVRSQTKSFSGFFYDAQEDMGLDQPQPQRYQTFASVVMA